MKKKLTVSILTTTYNRARYLKKLIRSLEKQTYTNFVWLVADDGSTDNTEKLIINTVKKKKLKIIYFKSSLRVGKTKLDNILLNNINTDLIVWCDSDDYFLPSGIENLVEQFDKIPKKSKRKFVGVMAQNIDTFGNSQTFYNPKNMKNFQVLKFKDVQNLIKGDATIMAFANIFKKKKFLEVDFLINESSLLLKLYRAKNFILIKKIVKIMDRNANLSVSFDDKLRYCRGSLYCISQTENITKFNKKNFYNKFLTIINYWRYAFHGEISFINAKKMWKITKYNFFTLFLIPFSLIIIIKDNIENKVEKTHRKFIKNNLNAKINKTKYF